MSDELKKSFHNVGYFRIDVIDKLSILSLNTLQWNRKDKSDDTIVREN